MDFKSVLETLKRNKEQKTIEEEALEANQCPVCMWPLDVNERGEKSCPVCNRIY